MTPTLAEAICAIYCAGTATGHGIYIKHHMADPGKFKHWPWDIAYGLIGGVLGLWAVGWAVGLLWIAFALIAIRIVVFNPIINLVRGLDFWYKATDKKGSVEHLIVVTGMKIIYAGGVVYLLIYNFLIL
jgi:hypothetical protein